MVLEIGKNISKSFLFCESIGKCNKTPPESKKKTYYVSISKIALEGSSRSWNFKRSWSVIASKPNALVMKKKVWMSLWKQCCFLKKKAGRYEALWYFSKISSKNPNINNWEVCFDYSLSLLLLAITYQFLYIIQFLFIYLTITGIRINNGSWFLDNIEICRPLWCCCSILRDVTLAFYWVCTMYFQCSITADFFNGSR